jgi:hypothetical protein
MELKLVKSLVAVVVVVMVVLVLNHLVMLEALLHQLI